MGQATSQTREIAVTAGELLRVARPLVQARGLTLIGVTLTNLVSDAPVQLTLQWRSPAVRDRDLDVALDRVKQRFGTGVITRAALVGAEPQQSVPMLPD
jgi:DNA polymerase IV